MALIPGVAVLLAEPSVTVILGSVIALILESSIALALDS